MSTNEDATMLENTCLTIGYFVISFSQLLRSLEDATIFLVGGKRTLVAAIIADKTAAPIVGAFFSVYHEYWKNKLTADDLVILKQLRREIDTLIKLRNRFMHDAWLFQTIGGDENPQSLVRQQVRQHGSGIEFVTTKSTPEDIKNAALDAKRLQGVVNGTTWNSTTILSQTEPKLNSRIIIVDGKIDRIK